MTGGEAAAVSIDGACQLGSQACVQFDRKRAARYMTMVLTMVI